MGIIKKILSFLGLRPKPCTCMELAEMILDGPRINGEPVGEISFRDSRGRKINMEVVITFVDGVQQARLWEPPI